MTKDILKLRKKQNKSKYTKLYTYFYEKLNNMILIKEDKYCIINNVYGDVMVSTLHQKYKLQVVDGRFGHLKKAKIKINADNEELALAA